MKKTFLLFTIALFTGIFLHAQSDTVKIIDSSGYSGGNAYFPARTCVLPPPGSSFHYFDSIRVAGRIINKYNRDYYLVVTDPTGHKRLEGNFHDAYANGNVIQYDGNGRKTAEGNFEMLRAKSPVSHCGSLSAYVYQRKTGTWKYYDPKGAMVREENYDYQKMIVHYKYFDSKGKITREEDKKLDDK